MATFTNEQADVCTITRCESFKIDGVHQHWVIAVDDEHGCAYEWIDETTSGDATNSEIKAAAKTIMLTKECLAPAPVKVHDPNIGIIGQTLAG